MSNLWNRLVFFFYTLVYSRAVQKESHDSIEIDEYNDMYKPDSEHKRASGYAKLVNLYYNVSTAFYELAWGPSFHFANRGRHETFSEAIKRHEYFLASKLRVKPGDKVLDLGCGVGGPLRNIAFYTGASITGINNNDYQVARGQVENKKWQLDKSCDIQKGDFHHLRFPDKSFQGAYQIEATCHAPDRKVVFGEIFRTLVPGAYFVGYEWCLTQNHDEKNPEHEKWRKQIEHGNGLPTTTYTQVVDDALTAVGFELIETRDMSDDFIGPGGEAWYVPLLPSYSVFSRWQFTKGGRMVSTFFLNLFDFLGIAPKGTNRVSNMLQEAASGLSKAGQAHTFTVQYLFVARKPNL